MSDDVDRSTKDEKPEGATPPSPQETAERTYLPAMFGGYDYSPAEEGTEATGGTGEAEETVDEATLRDRITLVLKDVYDPEIPVNIYDLGLIYELKIDENQDVEIVMTLTAPACPVAGALVQEVADRVGGVKGVRRSRVELVFDPPWTQDRLTEEAKLELGLL